MKTSFIENAAVFHLVLVYPLMFIAIYPETFAKIDREILRNLGVFLIFMASMYNVYLYLNISKL